MDRFGLVLRSVVLFLFPIPFLLDFAVSHGGDWTGWLAYIAVAVFALGAIVAGFIASRPGDRLMDLENRGYYQDVANGQRAP
jgi:hypothetical protein